MTAIQKMIEFIKDYKEEIETGGYFDRVIDEARRLALEEAKELSITTQSAVESWKAIRRHEEKK